MWWVTITEKILHLFGFKKIQQQTKRKVEPLKRHYNKPTTLYNRKKENDVMDKYRFDI